MSDEKDRTAETEKSAKKAGRTDERTGSKKRKLEIVDGKDVEIVDDRKAKKSKKDSGGEGDKGKDEKAGKDKEVEITDEKEEGYKPKQKPENITALRAGLTLRKQMQHQRPVFRRQEGHRYKKLETGWRKPRGSHSKLRRHYKYRSEMVSIGYGSPASVRHLHPSGFKEILVHNPNELEAMMSGTQAARIAHGVGIKKRFDIEKRADELGIRVLNRS